MGPCGGAPGSGSRLMARAAPTHAHASIARGVGTRRLSPGVLLMPPMGPSHLASCRRPHHVCSCVQKRLAGPVLPLAGLERTSGGCGYECVRGCVWVFSQHRSCLGAALYTPGVHLPLETRLWWQVRAAGIRTCLASAVPICSKAVCENACVGCGKGVRSECPWGRGGRFARSKRPLCVLHCVGCHVFVVLHCPGHNTWRPTLRYAAAALLLAQAKSSREAGKKGTWQNPTQWEPEAVAASACVLWLPPLRQWLTQLAARRCTWGQGV